MASTCLKRTPSADGNFKKYTFSAWLKRSKISQSQSVWSTWYQNQGRYAYIYFNTDDTLEFYTGAYPNQNSTGIYINTKAKYRDVNAWYHVVLVIDTDNATQADRQIFYVNGVRQELDGSHSNGQTLASSGITTWFNRQHLHTLGRYANGTVNFDGLMSHVHWCDGYAYAPTEFGQTDPITGEWKILTEPNVNYGTNGFFVFKDNAATTDHSGNNLSFSTEGTLTKTEDNPSNIFCTLNPLTNQGSYTFAHGNTYLEGNDTNAWTKGIGGTLAAKSGKYYWEVKQSPGSHTDYNIYGFMKADEVMNTSANLYSSGNMNSIQTHTSTGTVYAQTGAWSTYVKINGSHVGISDNDIVSFALDLDNRKCWLAVNGVWADDKNGYTNGSSINTSYPFWGTAEITADTFYTPASIQYYDPQCYYNFGNGYFGNTQITSEGTNASGLGKFEHDVPSGFSALCTKGLNL